MHCSSCRNETARTKLPVVSLWGSLFCIALVSLATSALAQSVGLPAPRLLTTMPMGGRAGSQVEVTITGDNLENADQLAFSDPRITAVHKLNAAGELVPYHYVVTIAANCPAGVHEARVMTRLGVSSSRAFSVGSLAEVTRTKPNTSLASAMELKTNSICNAVMTQKAVDHYVFEARKGQRVIVDCAARGIDSKLEAVLVVADAQGRDLLVDRRGGALDFSVPENGKYVIKVHELTFNGGPAYYYRLALQELPVGAPLIRLPSTRGVSSFSWPPEGLREQAAASEVEPNDDRSRVQKIALPCDLAGSFFPAADVDLFQFEAKQGDAWWVEVASERLGRPTDPAILVQQVGGSGTEEKLTDVTELSDIPSPVKLSSNGYAYDGPPYDAGSSDILGRIAIPKDGTYRLQLTDLFGGTRSDPRNVYRLVIRKAAPDFALVAWALHMELRNGDRNALSKPLALRGGATMALEVVAVRRDGFDGEIELAMEGLPEGVTARGLKIPAGKSRGVMLVTASEKAPRSLATVKFFGRAKTGGVTLVRPCRVASMAWPITDAWGEIPSPRLLADVPVSVSGFELAPLTITAKAGAACEAVAGQKLTIPLAQVRRSEFSGATLKLHVFGDGFERALPFDVSLAGDSSQAVLDLARLKTPPGEYLVSFYGGAVAKYHMRSPAAMAAEAAHRKAQRELAALSADSNKPVNKADGQPPAAKARADQAAKEKAAAALAAAAAQLKQAAGAATTKDIVDIVVSEPIAIRVKPAEKK